MPREEFCPTSRLFSFPRRAQVPRKRLNLANNLIFTFTQIHDAVKNPLFELLLGWAGSLNIFYWKYGMLVANWATR